MENQPGTWNVVGKPKKSKTHAANGTKKQKKQTSENMPTYEVIDPLANSSTMFDAFLAKERQMNERKQEKFSDKIEAGKEPNSKSISDGNQKKKPSTQKNKKHEQKKRSIEEAIKDLTEEELRSVLMQSKGHFPEKPELWLKDLVTFMNYKLENTIDTDKYLKPENKDYPVSIASKGCTAVIKSVLNDSNKVTLEHMLSFCMTSMLDEAQNKNATYGYKIFLQLLARSSPDVVISKLPQMKEVIKSIQNQPERCLMVLWALGQAGMPKFRVGIRVWFELMVPCLNLRSIGSYCVQYLEMLLSLHAKQMKSEGDEIKIKEYFSLLDLVYGTGLPGDIKKRLLTVFPKLKAVVYGQKENNTLHSFFPSYLVRATTDNAPQLKKEVLACLTECLMKEKRCYSLWCQLYLNYLGQTRVLLDYLAANWESLSGSLDKKLLRQTLMSFIRTNEESPSGRNQGELRKLTAVCEEFLKKLVRPAFPWRWVMFFLISSVIGIVVYDLYSSKNISKSRTIGFLEAYGILGFLQRIWDGICVYSSLVFGWLQINVPVYYGKVYDTMHPYVVKLVDFGYNIEEYTREYRHAVIDKIYGLSPGFWNEASRLTWICLDYLMEYMYWISGHIAAFYGQVYQMVDTKIIHGNFTTENIQEMVSWSAVKVQSYTQLALDWCRSFLN